MNQKLNSRVTPLHALLIATIGGMFQLPSLRADDASDNLDRFEARIYRHADESQLPYRLLKPDDYDPARKYPLVLFLHGAGERGDDNQRQLVHGMKDFCSDEIRSTYPCFVVAPQCPDGAQWVDTPWSAAEHTMPENPSLPLRNALELLTDLEREFSIDEDRVYVTGLSMGGYGAWDAVQRQPKRFAAAVPICGGGDRELAPRIAGVPVWVFHGDSDNAVPTKRSRDMVEALRKAGAEPRYTEYPETGHNAWSATYSNPEMYRWMFDQRRS